jgi:electron transfer flavoprotein beta subunit
MTTNPSAGPAPGPGGQKPLVVACLHVSDLRPQVDPLTGSVHLDRFGLGLAAPDAAALEYALRLGHAWSGRVLAVAAGPPSIDGVLRQVSALGVSVVRVPRRGDDDGPRPEEADLTGLGGDERQLARALVAAITRRGTPSLVLCGDRSADRGTGALPAFVAHELGTAQALGLVSVMPDPDGTVQAPAVRAERRLDGGWRERLRVPLPAVCSVEGAGVRLRRASLAGELAAGSSTIEVDAVTTPAAAAAAEAGDEWVRVGRPRPFRPRPRVLPPPEGDDPRIRLLALTGALVAHDPPTVIGPVSAQVAADELLGFLVRHGYREDPAGPEGSTTTERTGAER